MPRQLQRPWSDRVSSTGSLAAIGGCGALDARAPPVEQRERRLGAVVVLEEGRVSQTGTPTELLERPGLYRELATLQSERAAS